jgi:hypothetical protein
VAKTKEEMATDDPLFEEIKKEKKEEKDIDAKPSKYVK